MRTWGLSGCFAFLVVLGACGGGGGSSSKAKGSCDLTAMQGGGYCQDYDVVPAIGPYKDACSQGGGTWSDGGCTHANAWGGCTDPQGAITNWFYMGGPYASKADAQTVCTSSSGTFIDP